jgi:hypothetical protein
VNEKRVMRRLAGVGWQVETPGTPGLKIVRDDGMVLFKGPLVGTAEAASVAGVRPQNFVRDWASRPDFPAPVAILSSGRVWRESDVRAYAIARRRPAPDQARLSEIARRVAWWDEPARTLSRPEIFVARVLGRGSADDIADIEAEYGRAVMRRAVQHAPASLIGDKARNYWEVVLGMPHEPAPPVRDVTP